MTSTVTNYGHRQHWMRYRDNRINEILHIADYLSTFIDEGDIEAMYREMRALTFIQGEETLGNVAIDQILAEVVEKLDEIRAIEDGNLDVRRDYHDPDLAIEQLQDEAAGIIQAALTLKGHRRYVLVVEPLKPAVKLTERGHVALLASGILALVAVLAACALVLAGPSSATPAPNGVPTWTASPSPTSPTSAGPATKTVYWATTNDPTGPKPTSSTVKWPQTLYTLDPAACGTPVWLQVDVYKYSGTSVAKVDALISGKVLTHSGEDSAVYLHSSFELIVACPAPSTSPVTPAGPTSSSSPRAPASPSTSGPAGPSSSGSATPSTGSPSSPPIPGPGWITKVTTSCDTALIDFNLPVAESLRIDDANATVPFSPSDVINVPKGTSQTMYHLRQAIRSGHSDDVMVSTTGPGTVTLSAFTVPVNCNAPSTGAAAPRAPAAAAPGSNPPLASTGPREAILALLAFAALFGALGAPLTVAFRANKRGARS